MNDNQKIDWEFLYALLEIGATSSNERKASMLFRNYVSNVTNYVHGDNMGNSIASYDTSKSYRIMLSAHIDEIGLQVVGIKDNGLLTFRCIGGIKPLNLIGQQIVIHSDTNDIYGQIIYNLHDNNTLPRLNDCFIDIDATDGLSASKKIKIGDFATFSPNLHKNNNILTSKSIDNRVGVFIITQVFSHLDGKLNNISLLAAATTQEEIGLRGMAVLAHNEKPDICINIDVTDALELDKQDCPSIGNGCVMYLNADSNPVLKDFIVATAKQNKINLQLALGRNITGGTDCSRIQLFSGNSAVVDVAIPCKYMHTHYEKCDMDDILSCIHLLEKTITSLDADISNGKYPNFSL